MSTSIQTRRRGFPALLVGVALATAWATSLFDTGHSSSAAHAETGHSHVARAVADKPQAAAFQDEMRKLWEDHVTWTRLAIVAFADGSPGFDATATRLLKNQDDIGDAIKPFYGEAAGDQLTALLKDHILIAGQLIADVKSGSPDAAATQAAWFANADDIATFLSTANPAYWSFGMMQEHMYDHLTLTAEEAVARIQGRYADDIAAYDQIHVQILGMADMLANGIVAQFPNRFSR